MDMIDSDEDGLKQEDFLSPNNEVINLLGKVFAVVLAIMLVTLGDYFVRTISQLAALAIGTLAVLLVASFIVISKRRQRYTLRKLKAAVEARKSQPNWTKSKYDEFYEHITTVEQKLLQGAIIWCISLAFIGYIKLIPKGMQILTELMYNS